jgi:hypothetical protein
MKLLNEIKEIINKFNLNDHKLDDEFEKDDSYFLKKYGMNIPNGWYGFDLTSFVYLSWKNCIDEILEFLIKNDPNFEIHQIKLKFGGIRFYVASEIIEDILDIEGYLENIFYDESLIY